MSIRARRRSASRTVSRSPRLAASARASTDALACAPAGPSARNRHSAPGCISQARSGSRSGVGGRSAISAKRLVHVGAHASRSARRGGARPRTWQSAALPRRAACPASRYSWRARIAAISASSLCSIAPAASENARRARPARSTGRSSGMLAIGALIQLVRLLARRDPARLVGCRQRRAERLWPQAGLLVVARGVDDARGFERS